MLLPERYVQIRSGRQVYDPNDTGAYIKLPKLRYIYKAIINSSWLTNV